jgi:hypothetical protein
MRRTLGTAVFSGMLGVTLFGIFLTPVFYYVITWFGDQQTPGAMPTTGSPKEGEPKAPDTPETSGPAKPNPATS